MAFASIGLVFLYKTTSADPGMIPVGYACDGKGAKANDGTGGEKTALYRSQNVFEIPSLLQTSDMFPEL